MSNAVVETNGFTLTPSTLNEAKEYAKLIATSDFIPNEFKGKPANVMVACQMGAELGLKPLQSLQNIAVINGKPTVWGDAIVAIVRSRSDCEYIKESFDTETATASCAVKRRNQPEEVRTFSKDDATTAGLWGKDTWAKYPKRMLQMRARAFALRDVFGDALKGFQMTEEVQDYDMKDITSESKATISEPAPKEPAYMDEAVFAKNLPTYTKMIQSGKKSASELMAFLSTKAELSPDQCETLNAIKVDKITDAEVVA